MFVGAVFILAKFLYIKTLIGTVGKIDGHQLYC